MFLVKTYKENLVGHIKRHRLNYSTKEEESSISIKPQCRGYFWDDIYDYVLVFFPFSFTLYNVEKKFLHC